MFVRSETALNPARDMIDYAASKVAQLAVSRGVAELAARTGVTVNAVLPGPTNSEGFGGILEGVAAGAA